ncbi:hypothetical protein ZWY2020_033018 [Hordeum vulgare]|nr:hypothetical protein ZWY2020_033018 [Hordeum vulgare]
MAMKQAKPPPKKKSKGKGKAAVTKPSEADESQVDDVLSKNEDNESQEDSIEKAQHTSNRKTRSHSGDLVSGLPTRTKKRQNESSPPTSGNSVKSALPSMIRVPGAQAKKRKTGGSEAANLE